MSATLIGLTGRAGCGKDTAAALLIDTTGVNAIALAFADPMRNMLQLLLYAAGYHNPQALLEDRRLKETHLEPFGCSPRRLMQTLGTEWGRQMIKPTLWVDLMRQRLDYARTQREVIVITDVRFDDEAQLIHTLGGEVWQIERATDATNREMRRRDLEHRIAISAAASDIECYALEVSRCADRPGCWFETGRVTPSLGSMGPEYLQTIADAAEYLDLCGLLERHPDNPRTVRIKLEELPT